MKTAFVQLHQLDCDVAEDLHDWYGSLFSPLEEPAWKDAAKDFYVDHYKAELNDDAFFRPTACRERRRKPAHQIVVADQDVAAATDVLLPTEHRTVLTARPYLRSMGCNPDAAHAALVAIAKLPMPGSVRIVEPLVVVKPEAQAKPKAATPPPKRRRRRKKRKKQVKEKPFVAKRELPEFMRFSREYTPPKKVEKRVPAYAILEKIEAAVARQVRFINTLGIDYVEKIGRKR